MDQVEFRILGPMEILAAGAPCPLPSSAERALLVQLILSSGRILPASVLIDRLWSESGLPLDPTNALQSRVSKLRRALAAAGIPDLVSRDGVGYRADVPADAVDALVFERRVRSARSKLQEKPGELVDHLAAYDEALALWRGEPLVELQDQPWAAAEAARLHELRLAALTERSGLALDLGRHLEVVADLEPMVLADPTKEAMAGLLMVALYRSGRQAEALEVFTRTRTHLDEELGLEPSLSLRSTHERVLRQDPSLGLASEPGRLPSGSRSRPTSHRTPQSRTNLPTVERALIGRKDDLSTLVDLIATRRLVTLVGPGGAGKTALSLTGVLRTAARFPDGAYGVRLATVDTPDGVAIAIADALSVPLDGAAGDRVVQDRVIGFLGDKRLLLLLDNCEHVVDAVAGFVDELLGRCPAVTVVATSREALAVPHEIQVPVAPLPVPPDDAPAEEVLSYPAAQLFVERARAVRPTLDVGTGPLQAIAQIVRALDGIPLAIELAAARASSMSADEIAERLSQRFSLLTSGARTAESRQRTLKATVDWSYALLDPVEQSTFARLSVFQGGWTLPSAEAVVGDDGSGSGDVLHALGRLVEQSMVVVDSGSATTRYRMLETLRHYAAERLAALGETTAVRSRHAAHFRALALRFEVEIRGAGQRETFRRLREEQPNLRSALGWFTGAGDDPDAALEMAGALALFWHLGRHLEGRELLAELLADGRGSPAARARALQAVSIVERPRACLVHPSPLCAETATESLAIFEREGDRWRAALSKVLLAVEGVAGNDGDRYSRLLDEAATEFEQGHDEWGLAVIDYVRMETALKSGQQDDAVRLGRSAAAAFRALDDPWGLSAVLYHLGWGLRVSGRLDEAALTLEEAIDVAEGAGLYNTVQWALADLATERAIQGRTAEAEDLLDRAASASIHVGDGAGEVLASYGSGLLAQLRGDWPEARRRYAEAVDGFIALGTPVPEGLARVGLARCLEAVREDAAASEGYDQALTFGLRHGEPSLTASALEGLARMAERRQALQEADALRARAAELRTTFGRPAPPHERQEAIASDAGSG